MRRMASRFDRCEAARLRQSASQPRATQPNRRGIHRDPTVRVLATVVCAAKAPPVHPLPQSRRRIAKYVKAVGDGPIIGHPSIATIRPSDRISAVDPLPCWKEAVAARPLNRWSVTSDQGRSVRHPSGQARLHLGSGLPGRVRRRGSPGASALGGMGSPPCSSTKTTMTHGRVRSTRTHVQPEPSSLRPSSDAGIAIVFHAKARL